MPDTLTFLVWASKTAFTSAALIGGGLALHAAGEIVETKETRRTLRRAAYFGLGAICFFGLRLLLLNAQLAGDVAGALNFDTFQWIWGAYERTALALGLGALLVLGAAFVNSRAVAAAGALALATSFSLSGHVQDLEGVWLFAALLGLHIVLVGYWIVAPMTLWPVQGLGQQQLITRLRRFSRIAILAVPVLFVAGGWLALEIAGSIDAILTTAYGQLLLVKVAAATAALLLGAVNKQVVTAKVARDFAKGVIWLRATLASEAVLFAIAIGIVSWITTVTGPPSG